MRVLFETYPWAFATPGGGEMQILHYRDHLTAQGLSVTLHDPWRPNFDAVDVVHYFSCVGGSVHACDYVHRRGLPLVISPSLWLTATGSVAPLGEIRDQLRLADIIVTNSNAEADQLSERLDLPRERFLPVMNGVDARFGEPVDPAPFRAAFDLPDPFLLCVANIERRKNQLSLIEAGRRLGLPVVMIGHIREPDYGRAVLSAGGSGLRYLGAMDHADPMLAAAYAACQVFALPSTLETPGLAALEAAAAGAAVVVTAEGSAREYFGDRAVYVDPSDDADIEAGIALALSQPNNFELQKHVLDNFTWPKVTSALVDVYRAARDRQR
jgi:glycosyltransferase involved in cell wall biosynthesis